MIASAIVAMRHSAELAIPYILTDLDSKSPKMLPASPRMGMSTKSKGSVVIPVQLAIKTAVLKIART